MFNASRKTLLALALSAVALLIVGLAASLFPASVLAIIIAVYIVVAMIKQRSNPVA